MNTPYDPKSCRAIPTEFKPSKTFIPFFKGRSVTAEGETMKHYGSKQLPFLIGISGRKRSGKDTVATLLDEHPDFGGKVERIGFADALKREVASACDVPVEFIEAMKDNFRLILQGWGTDFRRELCGQDYWLCKFKEQVADTNLPLVVVPDVRFKNEFDLIKAMGGFVVRVERPELQTADTHISETELDNEQFDWLVVNDGSLTDLRTKVSMLALKIQQLTSN